MSQAADPTSTARSTPTVDSKLPAVTVEAARVQALRLKAHQFVTAVVIQPFDDAPYRWTVPICPLVAGLPKNFGEFILEHISAAAADAHAPLAGPVCRPNLYVVATNHPDELLKAWRMQDRNMYNLEHGVDPLERFLHSRRAVRAWYNTSKGCAEGQEASSQMLTMGASARSGSADSIGMPGCGGNLPSHIVRLSTASDIQSAIIVVDGHQVQSLTIQQLADYVAVIGLADVRLESDHTAVPSILNLFGGRGAPPSGLTQWDRALLYSLYNTNHMSRHQAQDMEASMVRRIITPPHANSH